MHRRNYRKSSLGIKNPSIKNILLENLSGFDQMNYWGENKTPFFFLIGFDNQLVEVFELENLPNDISFSIKNQTIHPIENQFSELQKLQTVPNFLQYKVGYDEVLKQIFLGNSYLCNYSISVPIKNNLSLEHLFAKSSAPYKLKYKDQFVCFSPETFVKIEDEKISTYPMKGTALYESDESLQNLLKDKKEQAEHYTVVDLLRNDLSIVADQVEVNQFRFPTFIQNNEQKLVQLSSEISGKLKPEFENRFGDIFREILPAGSICGSPKKKTLEIINRFENHKRGFYTGVFGFFDGKTLESAVCIRFIEKTNKGFVYKTGGGLTHQSILENEYQEILNKIYVPIS